jgi:flagellar basal-body rod modification protein FlgD
MTTPVTGVQTASTIQTNYLNLLVTQLQNQNPLEPMDNNQMASQLTQLSSLQQMENLNSNFSQVLQATQVTQANGLIGRQVSYIPPGGSLTAGKIDSVNIADGQVKLRIGGRDVGLSDVTSIQP